jgi:hypothetical protein
MSHADGFHMRLVIICFDILDLYFLPQSLKSFSFFLATSNFTFSKERKISVHFGVITFMNHLRSCQSTVLLFTYSQYTTVSSTVTRIVAR